MKVIAWRAWADLWNGQPLQEYASDVTDFEELPDDGLQGIIKFQDDGGKQVLSGYEWYFEVKHPSGVYIISGANDSADELRQRYPGIILKRGKHTTDEWIQWLSNEAFPKAQVPEGCRGC